MARIKRIYLDTPPAQQHTALPPPFAPGDVAHWHSRTIQRSADRAGGPYKAVCLCWSCSRWVWLVWLAFELCRQRRANASAILYGRQLVPSLVERQMRIHQPKLHLQQRRKQRPRRPPSQRSQRSQRSRRPIERFAMIIRPQLVASTISLFGARSIAQLARRQAQCMTR